MKKVAAVALVFGMASVSAFGGVVQFAPASIDITQPLAPFSVAVTVVGDGPFDAADMVIGSNDIAISGFTYSAEWTDAMSTVVAPLINSGFFGYTHDAFLSSNNSTAVGPTLLVGSVQVDPTGLALNIGDELTLVTDFDSDFTSQLANRGAGDPLSGVGTITVVPEPATISLLGLAAVGLIRRRKA